MFHNARLKIKRAEKHIAELHGVVGPFLDSDYYRFFTEPHIEDGKEWIVISVETIPLPEDVPLIIGDVLHNLRSSLDIMYNELIRHFGGIPTEWTTFPVRDDRDRFISAISAGPIEVVDQSVVDFIINAVQPYKGGNDVIYAVHDLNAADKHIQLTPVVSIVGVRGFSIQDQTGVTITQNASPGPFRGWSGKIGSNNKCVIARIPKGGGKVTDYGEPVAEVRFAKDQSFENQPVLPTLHGASEVVLSTIKDIAKLC